MYSVGRAITPLLIGVTGGIGSGKSYIAQILSRIGIPVFDCDAEAKALYNSNTEVKAFMLELFGAEVYNTSTGQVNRSFLASQIFSNEPLRKKVECVVHRATEQQLVKWLSTQQAPLCAVETALLYAIPSLMAICQAFITVEADLEVRIERIKLRDKALPNEIEARIFAQQGVPTYQGDKPHLTVVNNPSSSLLSQLIPFLETLYSKS